MQNNFTRKISQLFAFVVSLRKPILAASLLMIILTAAVYLKAAVGITINPSAPLEIKADFAKNSTSPAGGQFSSISAITISENDANDLGASNILEINAPTGWEFDISNPTQMTVLVTQSGTGPLPFVAAISSISINKISVTYSGGSETRTEGLTISGIKIRASNGASAPETVFVTISPGTNTAIPGLQANTNTVELRHVAGAATKLAFTTQPGGAVVGSILNPQPKLEIQDQFGNLVLNSSKIVTLAIGNNPNTGTLNGINSVNAVNGLVTFTNLSINKPGENYTLIASADELTGATSNPFNILCDTPAAPTVTGTSVPCGPGSVTLTASGAPAGGSYRWYTVPTGGTAIANETGSTYTTPSLSATTIYYVSTVSSAGCESANRTSLLLLLTLFQLFLL